MTDKVQKIKDWISKEQDGLMDAQGNFKYPEHEGAYHILCNLDAYIDSLQEEPVNRTHADVESAMQAVEEKSKAFTEAHKEESADEILAQMRGEEPVSDDLKEAAYEYADGENPTCPCEECLIKTFKAGANWQKAKDESTTEDLEEYINELTLEDVEIIINAFLDFCIENKERGKTKRYNDKEYCQEVLKRFKDLRQS